MNDPMQALASTITEKFILAQPRQAARALETLATHEILQLTASLKAQVLVACFNEMSPAKAAAVLRRLPLKQASHILTHLDIPQAAALMPEFSAPYRERLRGVLPESFLQLLTEASSYPPNSAGHLMQTDFVAIRTESKAAQLIERLKNLPRTKIPAVCFVTGKDGVLKGFIRTTELAFYGQENVCGSIMTPCEGILPQLAGEKLSEKLQEAQLDLIPVINQKQVLIGVLNRWTVVPSVDKGESFWKKWTR